ncbi:MAG TPA: DNA repair protein RecO [Candidatus Paceibacterota bacterium]|nr:DNA repair protein RecO [Candidatus Paceibacterota bacterium]
MFTEAIIIRTRVHREHDLLVDCYTERAGRLNAVARGALRAGSVQGMHLDRGNLVRFEAVPGRGRPIITGALARDSFVPVRSDLLRTAAVWVLMETVEVIVVGQERDDALWNFLSGSLRRISACGTADVLPVLRSVQLGLLAILGYAPRTGECAVCGAAPEGAGVFCIQLGGIVCPSCARAGWRGTHLAAEDIRWLSGRVAESPFASVPRHTPAEELTEYVAGRPLRSLNVLFRVAARPGTPVPHAGTTAPGVV